MQNVEYLNFTCSRRVLQLNLVRGPLVYIEHIDYTLETPTDKIPLIKPSCPIFP